MGWAARWGGAEASLGGLYGSHYLGIHGWRGTPGRLHPRLRGEWRLGKAVSARGRLLGHSVAAVSQEAGVFLTIDRWESAACFERFQQRFAVEYKELDARLEGYTLSERKVGVFEDEAAIP